MKVKIVTIIVMCLFSWPCDGLAGEKDQLVGHWTFEENFADASLSENHATAVNGVALLPGIIGQAAYLDGQRSLLRIPWSSSMSFGSGDFSVAAWICPQEGGHFARIVDNRGTGLAGIHPGWQLKIRLIEEGWHVHGTILDDGFGAFARLDDSETHPYGTWAHVALVHHAGVATDLYINGILVCRTEHEGLGILDNGLPLFIGGTALAKGIEGTPSQLYAGLLDDVRLYSRALGSEDITALYSLGTRVYIPITVTAFP